MEVPVINRMTEFEAGINNPASLISRVFSLLELGKLSLPHRLWKWGALFLALAYAITSLAYKIKLLFLHYHRKSKALLAATEPLLPSFDSDFSSSDDEDDAVSSDADEESEEEREAGLASSYEDLTRVYDDFDVNGKFRVRRRRSIGDGFVNFSLADLMNQTGVVRMWENISFSTPETVNISPAVVVSGAGDEGTQMLGLGLWDLRCRDRKPAAQGEWRSDRRGRVVGVDQGMTGRVYVRDDVTRGVRVGDVRKVVKPVVEGERSDVTWWDAHGVGLKED